MSLAQVISTYLTLNLLIALAFIFLKWTRLTMDKLVGQPSAATELRIHYMILAAIISLAMVHPTMPQVEIFQPAAKVWSAQSMKDFPDQFRAPDQGGYMALPFSDGTVAIDADSLSLALLIIALTVLALGVASLLNDIKCLLRMRRQSYVVRRVGRVSILANDHIAVPFSYWLPRQCDVVIPTSLIANRLDCRMAVVHELQHHRQSDTRWIYVMWALRLVCGLNPFVHLWSRWLSEIQEFACDETLVGQNKVESLQYASCLVEVAGNALNQRYVPVCATGLTSLVGRNLLKRRIEKMISTSTRVKKSTSWSIGGVLVAIMAATAFASQGLIQDRRVSMADAQQMAANAATTSDLPVVVNDLVLNQLNRYIGTPEGREFMRRSLQRMKNYRTLIEAKGNEYQVPNEIMALPIIESGYQNLAPNASPGVGAGIWMFLASTARNYGLRVDERVDDRLDVAKLTDAAMRYLRGGQLRFNDWLLSVLAFNIGEAKVLEGIAATGSRDAWVLVRKGYENDQDYLAKFMAAVLIMKNPEAVE